MSADHLLVGRIDRFLERRGITLRKFANDLKLPYRTVQNYMTGDVRLPASFLGSVCSYLGVEADYLLFGGVDVDRTAFDESFFHIFEDVLTSIDCDGGRAVVRAPAAPQLSGTRAQESWKNHITLLLGPALRDEYVRRRMMRLIEAKTADVYPSDEAVRFLLTGHNDQGDGSE
jgi:transcriptional regulator with XRE-family HTH domain